jgi:hypothetical protein
MCQWGGAIVCCAVIGLAAGAATASASEPWSPARVFAGGEQSRFDSSEESEFETDRDSFTPSTTTVAAGKMMVESAWSFIDNRDVPDTHSLPELVLRQGVNDWLELRFGTNFEAGGESSAVTGSEFGESGEEAAEAGGEIERSTDVSYGLKVLLSGQEGWVPESSLIVMGSTPTSGRETATTLVCTYVAGWTFDNGWKWDSALRYGTGDAEGDRFNRWAPSTVVKIPVGEAWDLHAEYFAAFTDGRAVNTDVHYFSPGAAYMVTENLELGVRVGWGLNDEAAKFFTNVGLGWQF